MTLRLNLRWLGDAARRSLILALIFALGPAPVLLAQVSAIGQSVASTPMSLHITILDGEDALNSIRERTAREPIVQVDDENHKPVAGALLLFAVQNGDGGAGATFNGLNTFSVTTGADGRGIAHGLLPNKATGKYTITVTASLGALVVTAIIHQSNVLGAAGGGAPPPPEATTPATTTPADAGTPATNSKSKTPGKFARIPKKYWVIGGTVVAVAAVITIVAVTGGKNPTTITPGTGTVGP